MRADLEDLEGAKPSPIWHVLTGQVLSTADDTDGDGLNDAAEFQLSSLDFDWQVAQPEMVTSFLSTTQLFSQAQLDAARLVGHSDVVAAPNTYNLYTQAQLQALSVGTPLLARDAGTGLFKLTIGIQKSTNLSTFSAFPFVAPQTTINAQGQIEFQFPGTDNAAFYRLQAK